MRHWQWAALAVLCVAGAAGLISIAYGYNAPGAQDEFDIVIPAMKSLAGDIPVNVKYPYFSFYFFGLFFGLAGTLGDMTASLAVARVVNAAVYSTNLILLYYFMRQLSYSRTWALIATFMFATLPWVMLSGAMVKTEGLLLTEMLVVLIALQKITGKKHEFKWHVMAAIGAGASVGTKYNVLPVMLYLFHLGYLLQAKEIRRNLMRSAFFFGVVFLVVAWAGIPSLAKLADSVAFYRTDMYFLPGAGFWKSVDEWDAFPWGRFSSFVFTTLPGSIGFHVFLVAGCLLSRSLSKWELRVFGGATAATLVIALFGTRIRLFHPFTSYVPFFLIASVSFLRWGSTAISNRKIRTLLFSAVVVACLAQWIYYVSLVPGYAESMSRIDKIIRDYRQTSILTFVSPAQRYKGRILRDAAGDELPVSFEKLVKDQEPQYIVVFSTYLINMCKYKHNELYRKNCAYYNALIHERTDYKIKETIDIDIGKTLSIDPEIRDMAVYFLEKPT